MLVFACTLCTSIFKVSKEENSKAGTITSDLPYLPYAQSYALSLDLSQGKLSPNRLDTVFCAYHPSSSTNTANI